MSVADVSQKAIANLGWSKVELTAPVFVGDTIYAESEVLSKRPSVESAGPGPRHGAHARPQGRRHPVHGVRAHRPGADGRQELINPFPS